MIKVAHWIRATHLFAIVGVGAIYLVTDVEDIDAAPAESQRVERRNFELEGFILETKAKVFSLLRERIKDPEHRTLAFEKLNTLRILNQEKRELSLDESAGKRIDEITEAQRIVQDEIRNNPDLLVSVGKIYDAFREIVSPRKLILESSQIYDILENIDLLSLSLTTEDQIQIEATRKNIETLQQARALNLEARSNLENLKVMEKSQNKLLETELRVRSLEMHLRNLTSEYMAVDASKGPHTEETKAAIVAARSQTEEAFFIASAEYKKLRKQVTLLEPKIEIERKAYDQKRSAEKARIKQYFYDRRKTVEKLRRNLPSRPSFTNQ